MSTGKGSVIRTHEYEKLRHIELNGSILDLGGSHKSGYHELIRGSHTWTVVNYGDSHPGADILFDIEKQFPLESASYDNVVTMNVLEHIFNYHNVFAEVSRVLKPGGLFLSTVPFMHHIHGSPDDYHRYTKSTYIKLAEKYGFEIVYIEELGYGFFSLVFQTLAIHNIFYFDAVYNSIRYCMTAIDKLLLIMPAYQRFAAKIPLGYIWIMKKKG
ncbi:MAG: hypothetical protein JWO50_251 [Candidatus Kaiserbacteria bacterium]|nr:hypothetical protein [Candidatus Kaiserbacteria bacterium]